MTFIRTPVASAAFILMSVLCQLSSGNNSSCNNTGTGINNSNCINTGTGIMIASGLVIRPEIEDERAPNVVLEGASIQQTDGSMAQIATGGNYRVPKSCRIEGSLQIGETSKVSKIVVKIYAFGFMVSEVSLPPTSEEYLGGGMKRVRFSSVQSLPGGQDVKVSKAVVEVHADRSTITKTVEGPIHIHTAA